MGIAQTNPWCASDYKQLHEIFRRVFRSWMDLGLDSAGVPWTEHQIIQNVLRNLSGVDGCPRGCGSASLAEVLSRQAQLEVLAACASQGVIERSEIKSSRDIFDRQSTMFTTAIVNFTLLETTTSTTKHSVCLPWTVCDFLNGLSWQHSSQQTQTNPLKNR